MQFAQFQTVDSLTIQSNHLNRLYLTVGHPEGLDVANWKSDLLKKQYRCHSFRFPAPALPILQALGQISYMWLEAEQLIEKLRMRNNDENRLLCISNPYLSHNRKIHSVSLCNTHRGHRPAERDLVGLDGTPLLFRLWVNLTQNMI